MARYGVQYYIDCEEHGLACQQETFEESDEANARRRFNRRLPRIRRTVKSGGPANTGTINLFRLNAAGTEGTLVCCAARE